MTDIRTALKQALQQLGIQREDSSLDAEILLTHVLRKNRAYLFAHPEALIPQEQLELYQQLILKRAQGVPIAYIIGYRDFWSLNLKVNEHTLIPRHETELLVELALNLIPDLNSTFVLDMGTGSGAIALAIAQEKPHWHVTACDFSIEALKVAKENAEQLNINNVSFYHSDWFESLPHQQYHAIISNPPYIAEQDPHLKQGDIRFEPLTALASGQEGLADLQYIIQRGFEYLLPDGLLLLEHGYDQKHQLRAILKKSGYKNVHCWQDIQGHDRVSGGKRP